MTVYLIEDLEKPIVFLLQKRMWNRISIVRDSHIFRAELFGTGKAFI